MFESFRGRFSTKDKKTNAFIEPDIGWDVFINEIKSLTIQRSKSFDQLKPSSNYQLGSYGKTLEFSNYCIFPSNISLPDVLQSLAQWTYFSVSLDHSIAPSLFHFYNAPDEVNKFYKRSTLINDFIAEINNEWDLEVLHTVLDLKKIHITSLSLHPKFTEADLAILNEKPKRSNV